MRRLLLLLLTAAPVAFAQTDGEIRRILADRIDRDHQTLGIVVGVLDASRRAIVAYGDVQPDSLFEIGSITKVFTALLLADMAERGEVGLHDPISKQLPASVKVARRIELQDLATHMSGLPRVPTNLAPKLLANPYADYTPAKLYEFLGSYTLPREPGSKWEYSNLGAGLLGHVLSLRAGMDFDTLVRFRICGPLDMTHTRVGAGPRAGPGCDAEGAPGGSIRARSARRSAGRPSPGTKSN